MIRQSHPYSVIEVQKRRQQEKEAIARSNLIKGIVIAPIYVLGWFPIVWIICKVFGK
jgi:uncharacterized membrane protein